MAAVVGAFAIATPASAVALAVGPVDAQSGAPVNAGSAIQIIVKQRQVEYGRDTVVSGHATPAEPATLQFSRAGSHTWQSLRFARTGSNGRFRFAVRLKRSGRVRVVSAFTSATDRSSVGAATRPTLSPSQSARVTVAARFDVSARTRDALAGQTVAVRGRLLPGLSGRMVRLQSPGPGGSWRTVSRSRTGWRGGFDLRYRTNSTGSEQLRVRFAGDRLNAWTGEHVGELVVFHQDMASWYYDGGSTACGFHARFGVANRTLPCGTRVTFRYSGRSVTAVVDDRGPYVYPRNWDLNQNTASALGFGGVGALWSSL